MNIIYISDTRVADLLVCMKDIVGYAIIAINQELPSRLVKH